RQAVAPESAQAVFHVLRNDCRQISHISLRRRRTGRSMTAGGPFPIDLLSKLSAFGTFPASCQFGVGGSPGTRTSVLHGR
ncbi:MAG TPA: hypothetical protein VKE96_08025, partial [Vicinamibacterales bacterium]|nr:hypothetical protein [Vicinamibacterales bacterium]